MHMLAALDLATGKIYYRIRTRKRHREFAVDHPGFVGGHESCEG
jgi:hypothetical protein